MYYIYYILPVLIMIPVGIYFYRFLKRIAGFLRMNTDRKRLRFAIALISVIFVVPAANIWGVWAVVVLHITVLSLITDLGFFLMKRLYSGKGRKSLEKVYRCGLIPVLGTIGILGYGYWNMLHVAETRYTVYTQKSVRKEGYRIALISDLHFGTTMDGAKLKEICGEIAKEQPDLVVLCGDLVDENASLTQMQEVFPILSSIESTYGTYFVYGNHDRARYSSKPAFTEIQLADALERAGILVLDDESIQINEEIIIIGREDWSVPERENTAALTADLDTDKFWLLLDHQPGDLQWNSKAGCDLQLSGHTHGGQIWPIGLISDVLKFGELNYGYQDMGGLQVIVSSGMGGFGYPIRTGHHSEYVIVELKQASETK